MTDLERILSLWHEMEATGADYVLATVIAVQGSSYRKPGACMLLTQDGRRAGTVSGGCLEAQVASRAWWLTAHGPSIQRYSTVEEDGDLPYGSGCGGVLFLLLERRSTAGPLLSELEQSFHHRNSLAVATIVEGPQIGRRAFARVEQYPLEERRPAIVPDHTGNGSLPVADASLQDLAELALASSQSMEKKISVHGTDARAWANFRPARPGLWIFGAGDDTQPLLRLAKELGWFVTVADGRSQLTTRERFPLADELHVLPARESPANQSISQPAGSPSVLANLHPTDAAVIMTHSFEQDARVLASLLALGAPLAYIGVLGPQRRTRELLAEAARSLNLPADSASTTAAQVECWLAQLHTPMGLDLGAESPETIAFSIVAEIQKSFTAATALPLREVRATARPILSEGILKPS